MDLKAIKRLYDNVKFNASYGAAGVAALGRAGVATGFPANDTIRVGVIGSGGRAQGALMPAAAKVSGVELVAVCDVYDKRTRQGLALCRPGATVTRDHHAILAREIHLHELLKLDREC